MAILPGQQMTSNDFKTTNPGVNAGGLSVKTRNDGFLDDSFLEKNKKNAFAFLDIVGDTGIEKSRAISRVILPNTIVFDGDVSNEFAVGAGQTIEVDDELRTIHKALPIDPQARYIGSTAWLAYTSDLNLTVPADGDFTLFFQGSRDAQNATYPDPAEIRVLIDGEVVGPVFQYIYDATQSDPRYADDNNGIWLNDELTLPGLEAGQVISFEGRTGGSGYNSTFERPVLRNPELRTTADVADNNAVQDFSLSKPWEANGMEITMPQTGPFLLVLDVRASSGGGSLKLVKDGVDIPGTEEFYTVDAVRTYQLDCNAGDVIQVFWQKSSNNWLGSRYLRAYSTNYLATVLNSTVSEVSVGDTAEVLQVPVVSNDGTQSNIHNAGPGLRLGQTFQVTEAVQMEHAAFWISRGSSQDSGSTYKYELRENTPSGALLAETAAFQTNDLALYNQVEKVSHPLSYALVPGTTYCLVAVPTGGGSNQIAISYTIGGYSDGSLYYNTTINQAANDFRFQILKEEFKQETSITLADTVSAEYGDLTTATYNVFDARLKIPGAVYPEGVTKTVTTASDAVQLEPANFASSTPILTDTFGLQFRPQYEGSLRLKFNFSLGDYNNDARLIITVDGADSLLATYDDTTVAIEHDIDVAAGSLVGIGVRNTDNDFTIAATYSDMQICYDKSFTDNPEIDII